MKVFDLSKVAFLQYNETRESRDVLYSSFSFNRFSSFSAHVLSRRRSMKVVNASHRF